MADAALNAPTVSVVIPTGGRPTWLARAIRSALGASPDGRVEVIVVPNGPHSAWHAVLAEFADDARVLVSPVETPHANVARNHGLDLARGEFVRFLDDDDYLSPEAATQVDVLRDTGADLCSGRIRSLDEDGADNGLVGFPESRDFACAAVEHSGFSQPTTNLFRRASIGPCRWRPDVRRFQDNVWMVTLASHHEWNWVHVEREIGVWFQHGRQRTSTGRPGHFQEPKVVGALFDLHDALRREDRLTPARAQAISRAIWHYAHTRFALHPVHATRHALGAQKIARVAHPPHAIFERAPLRWLPPLLAEWVLLPARWVALALRSPARNADYRRRV